MKKTILILIGLLASVCIFAQVDSATVASTSVNVFSSFWETIYAFLQAHLSVAAFSIFWVLIYALNGILQASKWTPANRIEQFIWIGLKAILKFISGKK